MNKPWLKEDVEFDYMQFKNEEERNSIRDRDLKFLKQWKNHIVEGFCKYDAESINQIYQIPLRRI